MMNFKIYINYSYCVRVEEHSNFKDFTLTHSDFKIIDFSIDDDNHYYYNGYPCSNLERPLQSDISEFCLLALEFCGISRTRTIETLSCSDCHIIDSVLQCFNYCEKDILKFEPGSYLHTTGYFDDSVNSGSVDVSVEVIDVEQLKN